MANQPSKGGKTPSKSRKPAARPKAPDESIQTEAHIDAIPAEFHPEADSKPESQPAKPVLTKPEPDKTAAQTPPEKAAEPQSKPSTPAPQPQRSSGFLPMAFGGLVAGGIGFAIAMLTNSEMNTTLNDTVAAQASSINALEAKVDAIPSVDLSGIEAAQDALASDIETLQARLDEQLQDLDTRIADIERLPTGEGTVSDRAIAAYEADLQELRTEIEAMTGAARAQLDAARSEAAAIEENAASAARAAAGRAALARIQTSLDNGAPLGAALGDLEAAIDAPAPDALLAAQDGVPTLASLQESFPDMASAALAAARRAGVSGEETTGFNAFLKNQFEVRSITPRDGTDADAVLSRAEAAIMAGRLSDALAEIAALPEEARVEMSDWLGQAEMRADAIAAVDILSTSLNDS